MYRRPRKNYIRDYRATRRAEAQGSDLLPQPDRRIRPLRLCQKGECRWLDIQCLRPSGPCPQISVPGIETEEGLNCETRKYNREKKRFEPCSYLRKPCNRRLYNCPFGYRTRWRCDECNTAVPIGDIYFVRAGLRVSKHRFVRHLLQDATAICGGCLEKMRTHRKDHPTDYWKSGIGLLRTENLLRHQVQPKP